MEPRRIAILGSGAVARTLSGRLREAGHDVVIGSRDPARAVAAATTLPEAATQAEIAINATPGEASLELLRALRAPLAEKLLIDVANAITIGPDGFAGALVYPGRSLAEELQRALPTTHVVKTLNTMHESVMANPTSLAETPPTAFLSGDDEHAKRTTVALLGDLGWPERWIIDLGPLATARGPEAFLLMVRDLVTALGPVPFALAVAR